MNKKIIWGIIVVIVMILAIVFGVNRKGGVSSTSSGQWQTYADTAHGFQISYPANWQVIRNVTLNKGAFVHTVFGPASESAASKGTLVIEVRKDMTAAQALKGILDTENTRASSSTVAVSDVTLGGVPANLVIISNEFMRRSTPDWQPEYVVAEKNSMMYVLGNGGIENGLFEKFYKSFTFVNATSSNATASTTAK